LLHESTNPQRDEKFLKTYICFLESLKNSKVPFESIFSYFCSSNFNSSQTVLPFLRVPRVDRGFGRKCRTIRTGPVEIMQGLGTMVFQKRGLEPPSRRRKGLSSLIWELPLLKSHLLQKVGREQQEIRFIE
jgi:hypothetical protein